MQQDQLIASLQQGNEKAFERIYQLYSESIFGVIYSITRDKAASEEILQDVFMKVWHKAPSYNPEKGRFFTWILNIARNSAIDKIRTRSHKNSKLNLTADNFVDILEDKNNSQGKTDAIGLKKYIDLLGPTCKNLINLLFFKGYTQKETAEELDIPLGTVKTRNRACIDRLRSRVLS